MKKTIAYLPKRKQEDLKNIVESILERLPQTEMIILYGSYARNEYVDYDERIEFGIPTSYMSDYDILVATSGILDKDAGRILDNVDDKYYKNPEKQTPVQFINDDIKKLNEDLSAGRYFYTQIKQEGVILYDSGNHKLARRRKLRYDEIKQQAEEYYNQKIDKAEDFSVAAQLHFQREKFESSIFNLHQAYENYYNAIRLVYSLNNRKQHNLNKLIEAIKQYTPEILNVFPRNSIEEKRLFKLLKDAYVEARYNPHFVVTKEDIEALTPKIKLLNEITEKACLDRLSEYDEKFKEENKNK